MAIAGKVAITLKGDWNNTTTYEKLDAVTYNNGLYIAKETSTGVTPVNGDTWMLSVQSVDAIEFEKIINGTTVVGKATNANTADTLNAETADLENIKTTFTEATTRENINSKETLGTLFGKIKKWFADLKTVAFTGSYNDLGDKPSIPTVGNGTITVTQNGTTKGTFTTNQSGNTTIALTDTDTNTWRGIQNNLTSDSTTDSLSAAMGKYLQTQINEVNNNLSANNAGAHNSIYRGKNLGSAVTAEQYAAIQAGTFNDLYIGDYWVINGVTWRIAAFDYYLRCGDSDLTTHHAVIVPDTFLYRHVMNDTNTTDGGYVGSKMYTEGLESAKTTIKAAFSGHVLSHRIYLINTVANGKPYAGAWYDSEVDLMCEEMVYGGGIFRPTSDGSTIPANYRVEKSQLPLFTYRPDLISNRVYYWLRDVVTAILFARVDSSGNADSRSASDSLGVRPAFCIY